MNKTANSTQEMAARLRRHGLRPTRQRIRLASLLLDGQDRHVSPEDVYEQL
ncbi:MAG TPA: transcriptional repressor, partial [Alphaproteobacteria bacterium]|nr:transcriptional repressor [Alphaproteobacteria bacterium]